MPLWSREQYLIFHCNEGIKLELFFYDTLHVVLPQVTGVVYDRSKTARYMISGTWDNKIEFWKVTSTDPVGGPGVASRMPTVKSGLPVTAWQMRSMP